MCAINDDKDDDSDDNSERETALTTHGDFRQKLGGEYYIFHQLGHKAHQCPSKKKDNEGGGYK